MSKELNGLSDMGSQRRRAPMQVRAGRPGNEGGVGAAWRNRMKM